MALKINGVRVAGVGANGRDGAGVIPGGKSGQILSKRSDADHDTVWTDLPSIDATLSQQGQAADANAVGNQINTINNIISEGDESTLSSAKNYTDEQVANLVNSAPETLDTLGELATAFNENKEVIDVLNEAITLKADKTEVPTNLVNGSATGSIRGISTDAEGDDYTTGINAFAIGNGTKASGKNSFASGQDTVASGSYSHVEGYGCTATAAAAHAEGYDTHATARYAHAEGASTTASGNNSHAEGQNTTSSGHYSHAEGNFTTSAGAYSHAEGNYTQTTEQGTYSHVEGSYTKASNTGAHAEGNHTEANGGFSHAEGYYTKAESMYQHVRGKYNIADDAGIYSTIVGNGDADTNRKNIHTLDWDGNAWFSGDVYVGSTSGTNKDEGSKKLATEDYINIRVPAWTEIDEGKVLQIINGTPTWITPSTSLNLIKFYIDEVEYEALPGMKWKYWASSCYSVDSYFEYNYNRISNADDHVGDAGVFVTGDDIIIENHHYELIFDNTEAV